MPAKIRRIDFSPDEWIAGTLGMTPAEEGLYIRICALIWSRGERITYEQLKGACTAHGNKLNALLKRLEAAGKIVRNGSEIGQKRAENELENARKRVGKAQENGAKGGRPNRLTKPDGYARRKANHQPSTSKEEGFSHKELNPCFLTAPRASPPLPSQGDGADALRAATAKERGVSSDDLITPEQRAAGLAELHRAMDAARRKAACLNGHAEAAE